MPADTPRDCVCLNSGHCWACLAAGRRCPGGCPAMRCADGRACGSRVAPAMPRPVFEDGTSDESIPPAPAARVCTTAEGLVDALRESLLVTARPLAPWASKPPAKHAMVRDLTVELDAHERALHRRPRRSAEVSS